MYKEALQEFEVLAKIYDKDKLEKIAEEVLDLNFEKREERPFLDRMKELKESSQGNIYWDALQAKARGTGLGRAAGGALGALGGHLATGPKAGLTTAKTLAIPTGALAGGLLGGHLGNKYYTEPASQRLQEKFEARRADFDDAMINNLVDDYDVMAISSDKSFGILMNKHTGDVIGFKTDGEDISMTPL